MDGWLAMDGWEFVGGIAGGGAGAPQSPMPPSSTSPPAGGCAVARGLGCTVGLVVPHPKRSALWLAISACSSRAAAAAATLAWFTPWIVSTAESSVEDMSFVSAMDCCSDSFFSVWLFSTPRASVSLSRLLISSSLSTPSSSLSPAISDASAATWSCASLSSSVTLAAFALSEMSSACIFWCVAWSSASWADASPDAAAAGTGGDLGSALCSGGLGSPPDCTLGATLLVSGVSMALALWTGGGLTMGPPDAAAVMRGSSPTRLLP
mmetsp:Transcript_20256/g.46454  ORF Transcript_20256/g.46454 Transcript_20256/m.46454 type:complete len:265 (-) Transcript_20256:165-959(-)